MSAQINNINQDQTNMNNINYSRNYYVEYGIDSVTDYNSDNNDNSDNSDDNSIVSDIDSDDGLVDLADSDVEEEINDQPMQVRQDTTNTNIIPLEHTGENQIFYLPTHIKLSLELEKKLKTITTSEKFIKYLELKKITGNTILCCGFGSAGSAGSTEFTELTKLIETQIMKNIEDNIWLFNNCGKIICISLILDNKSIKKIIITDNELVCVRLDNELKKICNNKFIMIKVNEFFKKIQLGKINEIDYSHCVSKKCKMSYS